MAEQVQHYDRVLYRLVMTDDPPFEGKVNECLGDLLDKLSSPDEPLRNKIVECCSHIIKRARAISSLQLPCSLLITKIKNQSSGLVTKNFALVFLELGLPRLSPDAKARVAVDILVGISDVHDVRLQTSLVHRLLDLIEFLPSNLPQLPEGSGAAIEVSDPVVPSAANRAFVNSVFLDVLLVPNVSRLKPAGSAATGGGPVPGLPKEALDRLASHPTLWQNQAALVKVKMEILRLAPSTSPTLALPLVLVAAADSETKVKEKAESLLRVLSSARQRQPQSQQSQGSATARGDAAPQATDEDAELARTLLRLFVGPDAGAPTARPAVSEAVRIKIMEWAMREIPEVLSSLEPLCLKAALQCLTSSTDSLLIRALGARLASFLAGRCRPGPFVLAGPLLLAAVQRVLIAAHGQLMLTRSNAVASPESQREADVRSACYTALATLAHRLQTTNPQVLFSDPMLLRVLFENLSAEAPTEALTVAEALGAMRSTYKSAEQKLGRPPCDVTQLKPLLLQNALSPHTRCRLAAVEWAREAMPARDMLPVLLSLHLADDAAVVVRKAAVAGLPQAPAENQLPPFPTCLDAAATKDGLQAYGDFHDLLDALLDGSAKSRGANLTMGGMGPMGQARALHVLWLAQLQHGRPATVEEARGLGRLVSWVRRVALPDATPARSDRKLLYRAAATLIARVAAWAPVAVVATLCGEFDLRWLRGWVAFDDQETRVSIASFWGKLVRAVEVGGGDVQARASALEALAEAITTAVTRRDARAAHGPLLAVGYIIAEGPKVSDGPAITAASAVGRAARSAVDDIHQAACTSLGLMGTNEALPLPPTKPPCNGDPADGASTALSREEVIEGLVSDVTAASGKERRAEAAVACLGRLMRGEPSSPHRQATMEACLKVAGLRDEELLFAAGEAMADVALAGERCSREPRLTTVLQRVMKEKATDNSPHTKTGAAIYLLVVLTKCRCEASLSSCLAEVQLVLVTLLREKLELTQESSAKALATVYAAAMHAASGAGSRSADEALASPLVAGLTEDLVRALRGPNASAQAVQLEVNASASTQLQTNLNVGASNPFADLCELSTDLGHPNLIYHFLALPATHAAWSGRRGSLYAEGPTPGPELFSSLEPMLPKLLPRLYRGRFLGTKAMEQLWKTLIPDGKAAVKAYLAPILTDLSEALGSRKWRDRQSAALALADLLPGRTYAEVKDVLERLWSLSLRVLDDLKESVQIAGLELVKSLTSLSARLTNKGETPAEQVSHVVGLLLPMLLHKGLLDRSKEVQAVSILMLVKIIKGAGDCIRPYLPELISALIEAQSALEPEQLQYIQFHATSLSMTEEEMETMRFSLSRSGPVQEALDHCLKELDQASIAGLMPALLQHLRSGVGLNTRCSAAQTCVVLASKFRPEIKPYTPQLLKVLAGASLAERSKTAQRFFLGALSSVAKLAREDEVRRLIVKLIREYRLCADTAAHRARRVPLVQCMRELISAANEVLEDNTWSVILPLAYMGRHDEDDSVKTAWREIWADGAASWSAKSGNTALALAQQLCAEIEIAVRSASWLTRRSACTALQDFADSLGSSLIKYAPDLLRLLLLLLPGRLWDGKEMVVLALVKVVTKATAVVDECGDEMWILKTAQGQLHPQDLFQSESGRPTSTATPMEVDGAAEPLQADGIEEQRLESVEREEAADMEVQQVDGRSEASLPQPQSLEQDRDGAAVVQEETELLQRLDGDETPSPVTETNVTSESNVAPERCLSYRGLVRVLLDQCRRPHRDYKRAAVSSLTRLALAFPQINVLSMAQSTICGLGDIADEPASDSNVGERLASAVDHVLRARCVESLGALFPPVAATDGDAYKTQCDAVAWLLPALFSRTSLSSVWSLRHAGFVALQHVVTRIYVRPDDGPPLGSSLLTGSVVEAVVSACCRGLGDHKYSQVRAAALEMMLALLERREMDAKIVTMPHVERIMSAAGEAQRDSAPEVVLLVTKIMSKSSW